MATGSGGSSFGGGSRGGELRKRAEDRLRTSRAPVFRPEARDADVLVTELQVHQAELEIQNEELRGVQADLAHARDRYIELYDFAPVGYLTLDGKGVVRESNLTAAKLLGIERREVVGRNFASLVVSEDGDTCYLHLQEATVSEGPVTTELRLRRPEGSFWARLETRAWKLETPASPEYWVTFGDVTARREAEEELKTLTGTLERRVAERTAEAQARAVELQRIAADLSSAEERERRRIAAMLHEGLQQDLVALRYRLDTLTPGLWKGTADEEVLQGLGAAIEDCVARTRELSYDLSPPAAQRGLLPALEWLSRDAGRRLGLNVTMKNSPPVEGVSPALAAVLLRSVKELLLNIRKHSGVSSAEIAVSRIADRIQVSVADRGHGFDASALITGKVGAPGSGLHSIEERLRFLGGDFDVASLPGEGCRVTLSLPDRGDVGAAVAIPPAGLEAVFETAARPGRVGPPANPVSPAVIRVLLADDHALTRQGLAALLTREKDMEVVAQAADGQEAVRLALELRPDVVLMDVSMPQMDGFEATSHITRQLPEIRVIGLSMYDDPGTEEKMRKSGAAAYLCKTGSLDRLIDAVRGGSGG